MRTTILVGILAMSLLGCLFGRSPSLKATDKLPGDGSFLVFDDGEGLVAVDPSGGAAWRWTPRESPLAAMRDQAPVLLGHRLLSRSGLMATLPVPTGGREPSLSPDMSQLAYTAPGAGSASSAPSAFKASSGPRSSPAEIAARNLLSRTSFGSTSCGPSGDLLGSAVWSSWAWNICAIVRSFPAPLAADHEWYSLMHTRPAIEYWSSSGALVGSTAGAGRAPLELGSGSHCCSTITAGTSTRHASHASVAATGPPGSRRREGTRATSAACPTSGARSEAGTGSRGSAGWVMVWSRGGG